MAFADIFLVRRPPRQSVAIKKKGEGDGGAPNLILMAPKKQGSGVPRPAPKRTPAMSDPMVVCKFTVSREFRSFCASHPEVKVAVGALVPEYLALRERACSTLCKSCLPNAPRLPSIQTNLSSPNVMFALRHHLMLHETLTQGEALMMIRAEMGFKTNKIVIEKATAVVMETATALTERIRKSSSPREDFTFLLMPGKRIVVMETGFFASARRRCAECAAPGVRRCGCGLVWHCSAACQLAHWGPASSTSSTEVKLVATPDVKVALPSDVKAASIVPAPHSMCIKSAPTKGLPERSDSRDLRRWHREICTGLAVDRSVIRAAQMVLYEGFRPIHGLLESTPFHYALTVRVPHKESGQIIRTAIYREARLELAKASTAPTAAAAGEEEKAPCPLTCQ